MYVRAAFLLRRRSNEDFSDETRGRPLARGLALVPRATGCVRRRPLGNIAVSGCENSVHSDLDKRVLRGPRDGSKKQKTCGV